MRLLKLIGLLLDYPQDELWQHAQDLRADAADPTLLTALPDDRRAHASAQLSAFVQALLANDPLQAQASWLSSFDRGRAMSLLLFEHIHGESRDRGQAMADLMETYLENGYHLAARELPDYLPLLLEYLAGQPEAQAREWLGHIGHITALLAARAAERDLPHAPLLALLAELGTAPTDAQPVDHAALRRRAHDEPRDDTPEVMDHLWEEEAVRFNAAPQPSTAASCATMPCNPRHPALTIHPEVTP